MDRWLKAWMTDSNLRPEYLIQLLLLNWMLIPFLMNWCLIGYIISYIPIMIESINHISSHKYHACTLLIASGERLSDHHNQYKSSICLSSPVWSKYFTHTADWLWLTLLCKDIYYIYIAIEVTVCPRTINSNIYHDHSCDVIPNVI